MAYEENDCERHLNLCKNAGIYQNQSGKIPKSLTLMIDKSSATNLRLSAFICGLKFYITRQPNFIKKMKYQLLLFVLLKNLYHVNVRR